MQILDIATSVLSTVARLGFAEKIGALGARPAKPLELFEFEACPYCRKTREALTVLDLDAIIRPCPSGGPRFRPEVKKRGGKAQFPYLVDPNTGEELYESEAINGYLFEQYGSGEVPLLLNGYVALPGSLLASAFRAGRGRSYRHARAPKNLLELYSYEGSPFCRLVRETLCELEIPYLLHNVAHGSPKRDAFVKLSGKMQVPYLVDPNTGTAMFESADIIAYLGQTYSA